MVIFVRVGLMFIVIINQALTKLSVFLVLFHGSNILFKNGRDGKEDEEMKTTSTQNLPTHIMDGSQLKRNSVDGLTEFLFFLFKFLPFLKISLFPSPFQPK